MRRPLLALAMLALLAAIAGGLARLGWPVPGVPPPAVAFHGPLMVAGFLGTLIALERAVAVGHPLAYAAPLATGLGALVLLGGLASWLGALLMAAGSAGLVATVVVLIRRQPALFAWVMAGGAAAWLGGQALWLAGWPIHRVTAWWMVFLVLTIAGERLELARLARLTAPLRATFAAAVGTVLAGLTLTTVAPGPGVRVVGLGLLALALWLASRDVARRTVRQAGLTRFIALCILSGYVWLGTGGLLALLSGDVSAGPRYDALLHAVFLGFVFAMIFGHAPIIFPVVVGRAVTFRPAFYAHLLLLHLTLAARLLGDLTSSLALRRWGGLLNAATLVLFLANTAHGIFRPATRPGLVASSPAPRP